MTTTDTTTITATVADYLARAEALRDEAAQITREVEDLFEQAHPVIERIIGLFIKSTQIDRDAKGVAAVFTTSVDEQDWDVIQSLQMMASSASGEEAVQDALRVLSRALDPDGVIYERVKMALGEEGGDQ